MLRVLTLSTLFPSAARPTLGLFVARQTLGLARRGDVELQVVAPVGLPLWPLSHHPHYAPLRRLPVRDEYEGLTVHRPRYRVWPVIGARRSAAAMADALAPMLAGLRRHFPFDVIDAQFFWPDGVAAARLADRLGLPCSIKARGSDIHHWAGRPGISGQIVAAGRRAEGLLAVSAALREEMAARGLPADRIRVHHTGVDTDRFRPVDRAAAKRALGVAGPLLASAGALIPLKGQRLAIEALARLDGATLLVIGGGPDRPALERLARRLGLAERVRFLGNRPQSELPALFAAADVLVQPSLREGLANVWVEALACGTPVVTCDVGGARDVVDRPEAGRIVARDPAAVAAAVRDLLDAPPDPARVREAAARFSWDRNADELFEHLSAITARGRAPF